MVPKNVDSFRIVGYPDNTIYPQKAQDLYQKCGSKKKQDSIPSRASTLMIVLLSAMLVGSISDGSRIFLHAEEYDHGEFILCHRSNCPLIFLPYHPGGKSDSACVVSVSGETIVSLGAILPQKSRPRAIVSGQSHFPPYLLTLQLG